MKTCCICDGSTAQHHTCAACGEGGFCATCAAPGQHYCVHAVIVPHKRLKGRAGRCDLTKIKSSGRAKERKSGDLDKFLQGILRNPD